MILEALYMLSNGIPRGSCSSPPSWPLRPNPTIGRQRVRYLVKNKED